MNRSNRTQHVEIRFEDGEVFGERHRESIGGFANMMTRIATRTGVDHVRSSVEGDEVVFTAGDRRFRVANVMSNR